MPAAITLCSIPRAASAPPAAGSLQRMALLGGFMCRDRILFHGRRAADRGGPTDLYRQHPHTRWDGVDLDGRSLGLTARRGEGPRFSVLERSAALRPRGQYRADRECSGMAPVRARRYGASARRRGNVGPKKKDPIRSRSILATARRCHRREEGQGVCPRIAHPKWRGMEASRGCRASRDTGAAPRRLLRRRPGAIGPCQRTSPCPPESPARQIRRR